MIVVAGRGDLVEPGPGPLQRALDRRGRGAEHGRDLGGGEAEHLPQQEHGPLPGGRYCRLAMSASRRLSRAATIAAGSADRGHQRVRDRLQPRHAGLGRPGGASGSSAGAPRPDGSARRPRCPSAVRQALVAMR